MAFNRARFLIEVLGPQGATSLAKAAERHDYLNKTLVPRSVLAWLAAIPTWEGAIPGSDCQLAFQKSESGFTGHVQLGERRYDFNDTTIFHVAGAIATAVELDDLAFGNARNVELNRLGKSIDLLARVQMLAKATQLVSDHGHEESSPADKGGEYSRQEIYQKAETCEVCGGKGGKHEDRLVAGQVLKCRNAKPLTKDEGGHGSSAGPIAPAAPAAPTGKAPTPSAKQIGAKTGVAPASAGMKSPKPAGPTTVKLARSEVETLCGMCGQGQFLGDEFTGCACFKELSKSVRVMDAGENDSLILDVSKIDRDTLVTLLEAVGRL